MRWAGVVAVATFALLLPGCEDFLGGCPPRWTGASWTEPGLFNATLGFPTTHAPGSGLPFQHPPRPEAVLVQVGWSGPRDAQWPAPAPRFDQFVLTPDGVVMA